jgi:hypothetical protein
MNKEIANDKDYKYVEFLPEKMFWKSSSQGWAFDHCSINDFLVAKEFVLDYDNARIELDCIYNKDNYNREDVKCYYNIYDKTTDVTYYENEIKDINGIIKEHSIDVPPSWEGDLKEYENRVYKEYNKLYDKINKNIDDYCQYYPEKEEVREYLLGAFDSEFKYTDDLRKLEFQDVKPLSCYEHKYFEEIKDLNEYVASKMNYNVSGKPVEINLLEGIPDGVFTNIENLRLLKTEKNDLFMVRRSKKDTKWNFTNDLFVFKEEVNRDSVLEFIKQFDNEKSKVNKVEINRDGNLSCKEGEGVLNGNGSKKKSKSR